MEAALTIVTELEEYLRKESLTISQFAKHASLHSGTLSNIMRGRRPIAMQQLDRITEAMGYPEGFFYELFINNYVIEGSADWRRVGPLLLRCAELGKLEGVRQIAQHIMDNLIYSPLLFDTAEEMFAAGQLEAAAILYECVAEGERFQHSERLAQCQFRLFTIALGDDQDKNLWAANRFEPYVERLDEVDQLDALKELANTYRSLQRWDKVDELAEKMGHKARIQYEMMHRPQRKVKEEEKKPSRPMFFYIAYSDLLRANVCDEVGDYEQALQYKQAYGNLSWVKEQGEEVDSWIKLFVEWSQANIYITKLLSGDISVISPYTAYIRDQRDELVTGLLYIMKAANKYHINVDMTLRLFQQEIEESIQNPLEGRYNREMALDRQANLMLELAKYFLFNKDYNRGFNLLLNSLKNYQQINNEKYIIECVTLFERFRKSAAPEMQNLYKALLLGGIADEEEGNCIVNSN
ncbi:helix-turn-helix domain-containing protein ['Paenibacillus yunnanensis' Narsing Rao et al. 2020]|uniref:helix-turn-helix domain-containing protein n=1 Tax=Paenibacillus tengchongensis TaxID=2608684 RepID=UPI00124EBB68|nr:helix-turn-helix transcriptional regulator [Paenibacillus tengchongensis]